MKESIFDRERINGFFHGKSSDDDSTYIDMIINDGAYDRELKKLMSEQFDSLKQEDVQDENDHLEKILHSIWFDISCRERSKRSLVKNRLINWTVKAAAVLFLPLLIYSGLSFYKHRGEEKDVWVEITAPAWTRAQFSLPDGTTGWLNSKSSIKYAGNFAGNRQVELNGEAYFDVKKDQDNPFLVSTGGIQLEVLGTRFNVSSYHDEKEVEVVLEEGSLRFINLSTEQSQIMNPNDLIIYDRTLKSMSSSVVQTKKYLAWTEGALIFRNDPIDVIARRIGRWYNADVEIAGNIDSNLRLRATFFDENLEEVLKILKISLPIDYRIQDAAICSDSTYTRKKIMILSAHNKRN
jgi:ferric-dicitrate binding protein FerR (iron transport regulator)